MRLVSLLIALAVAGCTVEEPTCEDYALEQIEMMKEICEVDPGLAVCTCWEQGLDLEYTRCGCSTREQVMAPAIRRCEPPSWDWLMLGATLAYDECPND